MKNTTLFFLILIIFHSHPLYSQSYYFTHYQVEQGLSNNTVFCSLQDQYGFLWFGTRDGLNRFDGHHFKIFKINSSDDDGFRASNFIKSLEEDFEGNLWIGTDQGIYLFNPRLEEFRLFDSSIFGDIVDIQKDKNNNIWFINDGILFKYRRQTKSLIKIRTLENNISSFTFPTKSKQEEVWVGTMDGELQSYSPEGKLLNQYSLFTLSPDLSDQWIEKIYYATSDRIIIGTRKQGLKIFHPSNGHYSDAVTTDYNSQSVFVRDIKNISGSDFWIATESGIMTYNIDTREYRFVTREKSDPWALSDNAVYTILQDTEGGIWAGTYFGGVNYLSEKNTFFEKFFPMQDSNTLSGFVVREIVEDHKGNLWIGTEDNGLNKYNPQNNTFIHFSPSKESGSISHSNIHGLLLTGDTLWIGTFEHGLDWLDINTGKVFKHFDASSRFGELSNNFVLHMIKTRDGGVLLATSKGIYNFDPKTGIFNLSPHFPGHLFYTTLYQSPSGVLWAGTWRDGVFYYDPDQKEGGSFKSTSKEGSLPSNRINRIFEDSEKRIWIATEGGLSKHHFSSKTFKNYTTEEGLPSNLIFSFLEDKKNNIWISTSKGLVQFNPESEDITIFTTGEGLLTNQFNYNSSYADASGNFYFGSIRGMIRFNPAQRSAISQHPPLYLTGLQIQNEEVVIGEKNSPLKKAITFTEKLSLKHHQSTISLDFAAINYSNLSSFKYAYKLDGIDKTWTVLEKNRKIYFTNLPAGKYLFRIKTMNSSGQMTGQETSMEIAIQPPLWQSFPAYLVYIIISLSVLFLIIWNYDRRIKEKNRRRLDRIQHKREKKLYDAKIDFFTHIVHEIKTPLTMIKAPVEKLMETSNTEQKTHKHLLLINKNTERLITLSSQLLDFRKVETEGFQMNFAEVNIIPLLNDLLKNYDFIAKNQKYDFITEIPDHPIYADIDKEAFTKIITNLLDNAFKYGDKYIKFTLSEKLTSSVRCLKFTISNDGSLIPGNSEDKVFKPFYRVKNQTNQRGTGIGLSLALSLTELMNGTLNFHPTETGMNCFVLHLPKKRMPRE